MLTIAYFQNENVLENLRLYALFLMCLALLPGLAAATDVSVWKGQYYTGTTFNAGTYDFEFTVYDSLAGGTACYSNTVSLTTGNWGEWETEQSGVGASCNNASKDYFLNVNIDGADQTPRRRLVVWNSLRKDVDELTTGKLQTYSQVIAPVIQADAQIIAPIIQADAQIIAPIVNASQVIADNLTTDYVSARYFIGDGSLLTGVSGGGCGDNSSWNESYVNANYLKLSGINANQHINIGSYDFTANSGFFSYLGSLANRITNLFAQDIDASGNINVSGSVSATNFIGDGSLLTNLPAGEESGGLSPVYLATNLTATNAGYTTIFNISLTPGKMNIAKAYLAQSSSANGAAIQNRAIVSESGPIGNCNFVTQNGAGAERIDNIAVSANSADTGSTSMSLDTNVPFINAVTCAVLADASQKKLIIQFKSETVATVTTYAGAYYTNAVN